MRPTSFIFAVLPHSSSVSVRQVTHTASHPIPLGLPCLPLLLSRWDSGSTEFCGAVRVPAARIPGRRVESGGQRENCSQRELTCRRRAQQTSPAPPAPQPGTGFLLAEPQLGERLNTALTAVSVLCRRDLRHDVEELMNSHFAVALGCIWFA